MVRRLCRGLSGGARISAAHVRLTRNQPRFCILGGFSGTLPIELRLPADALHPAKAHSPWRTALAPELEESRLTDAVSRAKFGDGERLRLECAGYIAARNR